MKNRSFPFISFRVRMTNLFSLGEFTTNFMSILP